MNRISPHVRLACYIETTKEIFYVPWRMIYDYEFYYVVEGEIVVITEEHEFTLRAGDLHIMRPFNWHRRIAKSSSVKYYNVHFDFLKLENTNDFSTYNEYVVPIKMHEKSVAKNSDLSNRIIYEPLGIALPLKMTVTEGAKYVFLLNSLVEHFKNEKKGNELLVKADMLVLLAYLMQENPQEADAKNIRHNSVTQFTQVLATAYNEKIYLGDLAEQSGLSPAQMRKVFRKVNHISPREYLIGKRIEEAKYLLEEGKENVSSIAEKVGYENVNYFSRIFKKKTGMSPMEYRASIYGKKENRENKDFFWCDVLQPDSYTKRDEKGE